MRRFDRLRRILTLDPAADCDVIYQQLSQYEFPWDIGRALELALFRTYAVPSIGRLLDRTGEFARCPQKRYDDTALVLYEILRADRGDEHNRAAVEHLNRIHAQYRISNDDYRYTLATFVVTPVRWIEAYGWRALHPHEVRALTNTMRRMGEGMRIVDLPETYAEFARLLDDYERANFDFDPGGRRVAESTLRLFGSWFPRPLSGPAIAGTKLLMEPHLLDAFRFTHPPVAARKLLRSAMRARAWALRMGPPRPDSRPVLPKPVSYPHGYTLHELGPGTFHRRTQSSSTPGSAVNGAQRGRPDAQANQETQSGCAARGSARNARYSRPDC